MRVIKDLRTNTDAVVGWFGGGRCGKGGRLTLGAVVSKIYNSDRISQYLNDVCGPGLANGYSAVAFSKMSQHIYSYAGDYSQAVCFAFGNSLWNLVEDGR